MPKDLVQFNDFSQLQVLAEDKAKIRISPEHEQDFKDSLEQVINMFIVMQKVPVCEFKASRSTILTLDDIREDQDFTPNKKNDMPKTYAHMDNESGYFKVPKVIDDQQEK